ncbi:MAG: LPS assembly protein LptD [Planctomycetia bacterium]|nr:LPS assembly protein LptD [Planctomycetia bacterium]
MPGRLARAVVALGLLLAAAATAPAEQPAPPPASPPKREFSYEGLLTIREDEDGGRIATVSPSAVITYGDLRIYADHLVIWMRKDSPELTSPDFQLREFYAEGHLRMESGRQVLEGERAYVNLETGTLLVQKVRLRTQSKRRALPITLGAEELRRAGQGDTTGTGVTVTTCDFEIPDYRLVAKEVVVHGEWKSGDIDVFGVTLRISPLDFPVFYAPWLPVSFGSQIPLRKLRYERSRNFGHSVFSKFGIDLSRTRRDADGNPVLDQDGDPDTDTWGDLGFDIDLLQRRGLGLGPEYEYAWEDYLGFGDVYYIHDRGDVPPSDFNSRLYPIEKDDRGRGRLFHRHTLWSGLSADLEFHYVSDRNFREEFLEKEFKNDKAPESYALVRFIEGNFAMTGLYRPRINSFQDYVEYLPQFTQSLVTQPLWGGVYLSHHAQWANVRHLKDERVDGVEQPRTVRADVQETLTRPFSLGPVRIMPWGAARWTYYDVAPGTDWWVDRYTFAWGARARIAAWKMMPFNNDLLRLQGIRHIASLEARYFGQYTTVASTDLYQFDAVDQADRFQEFSVEFRNRFETKNPATGEIYDALNIGLAIEFYPDHSRDTRRRKRQNVLYPAYWIGQHPEENRRYRSRRASNINLDVEAAVSRELTLAGSLDWSPYSHEIEESHAELRLRAAENLTFRLTQQYVHALTGTLGVGFDWRLSEKWTVSGETEYDFRNRRWLKHEYGLRRNMHDFDLELRVRYDDGREEFSASIGLIPHGKKERRVQGP